MKQMKALNWKLKQKLTKKGLNPNDYGIKEENGDKYILMNKKTKEELEIDK